MPRSHDVAAMLQAAREALAEAFGPQGSEITLEVRNAGGQAIRYTLPAVVPLGPVPSLSPLEADILRVIGSGALKGRAVASRLGLSGDGSFRAILANLVARGVLVNHDGGYRANLNHQEGGRAEQP